MVVSEVCKQMWDIMSPNPNCDVRFETDLLVESVLGKKRIDAMGDEISPGDADKLLKAAQRRRDGYPLQYILGRWYFFDMELLVGEGVLIPRQDTETVCEAAFEVINNVAEPAVLDLCSGSGCIALAIKKYCPHSNVVAIEKSPQAFEYLKRNIEHTSLKILPVNADIFKFDENVDEDSFDVIISNPPYINPSVKPDLQTEVSHEPDMALFAADNGLRFYRFIAHYYKKALREKGFLVFEYGYDQQAEVKNILIKEGYTIVKEIVDLGGKARGVVAQK